MNRQTLAFRTLLVALMAATAACATHRPVATATPESEAFAARRIAEKVDVAAAAQRDYAALVASDQRAVQSKQLALDTDEVDVDYIGTPQELLQTLAHRYGYRYVESGRRADLRTINLRYQRTSPIEILRSIGHQVHGAADVVLDKPDRTIRLIYKPTQTTEG